MEPAAESGFAAAFPVASKAKTTPARVGIREAVVEHLIAKCYYLKSIIRAKIPFLTCFQKYREPIARQLWALCLHPQSSSSAGLFDNLVLTC